MATNTGIASLFSFPNDQFEMFSWLFANYDEHQQVIMQIQQQKNITIAMYDVRYMDPEQPELWALPHQALHDSVNAILGFQGNDFVDIDWRDPAALEGMMLLHATEHLSWRTALAF